MYNIHVHAYKTVYQYFMETTRPRPEIWKSRDSPTPGMTPIYQASYFTLSASTSLSPFFLDYLPITLLGIILSVGPDRPAVCVSDCFSVSLFVLVSSFVRLLCSCPNFCLSLRVSVLVL